MSADTANVANAARPANTAVPKLDKLIPPPTDNFVRILALGPFREPFVTAMGDGGLTVVDVPCRKTKTVKRGRGHTQQKPIHHKILRSVYADFVTTLCEHCGLTSFDLAVYVISASKALTDKQLETARNMSRWVASHGPTAPPTYVILCSIEDGAMKKSDLLRKSGYDLFGMKLFLCSLEQMWLSYFMREGKGSIPIRVIKRLIEVANAVKCVGPVESKMAGNGMSFCDFTKFRYPADYDLRAGDWDGIMDRVLCGRQMLKVKSFIEAAADNRRWIRCICQPGESSDNAPSNNWFYIRRGQPSNLQELANIAASQPDIAAKFVDAAMRFPSTPLLGKILVGCINVLIPGEFIWIMSRAPRSIIAAVAKRCSVPDYAFVAAVALMLRRDVTRLMSRVCIIFAKWQRVDLVANMTKTARKQNYRRPKAVLGRRLFQSRPIIKSLALPDSA